MFNWLEMEVKLRVGNDNVMFLVMSGPVVLSSSWACDTVCSQWKITDDNSQPELDYSCLEHTYFKGQGKSRIVWLRKC